MLCLISGAAIAMLPLPQGTFTLAWTHSVEKIRWEEDYRLTPTGLAITQARIKGSGAGMEPPRGAVRLPGGWWSYLPAVGAQAEVSLAASDYTGDYDICVDGNCRALGAFLPRDGGDGVSLRACPD